MLTVLFSHKGPLAVDVPPKGFTMTRARYAEVVIPRLVGAEEEQRPKVSTRLTYLPHDDVYSHKSNRVVDAIVPQGITALDNPRNFTDIAP